MDHGSPASPDDRSSLRVRLELSPGEAGEYLILSLVGSLDVSTSEILEHALRRVEAAEPRVLVLDLRELGDLDASGLLVILGAMGRTRRRGGRAVLVRGPRKVQRIFGRVGLDDLLPFVDLPSGTDAGEALAVGLFA